MNNLFFETLFDENESTCFAKVAKGTRVYPISTHPTMTDNEFFCINPLHPTKDLNVTEEYHSEDKPRRCDKNVVVYRNILVEIDTLDIDSQLLLINDSGMPYSTAVYSGGKSVHFIISLETPCVDEAAYRKLVERLYRALNKVRPNTIDQANKNPSRLSRFPSTYRADKNKSQKVIKILERINNSLIEGWIFDLIGEDKVSEHKTGEYVSSGVMNGFTLNFVMFGAPEGQRNSDLFKASCDLAKCGYNQDAAYNLLAKPSGLDDNEVTRTIKSAFNKVANSP